jgi:hypothetical protein
LAAIQGSGQKMVRPYSITMTSEEKRGQFCPFLALEKQPSVKQMVEAFGGIAASEPAAHRGVRPSP